VGKPNLGKSKNSLKSVLAKQDLMKKAAEKAREAAAAVALEQKKKKEEEAAKEKAEKAAKLAAKKLKKKMTKDKKDKEKAEAAAEQPAPAVPASPTTAMARRRLDSGEAPAPEATPAAPESTPATPEGPEEFEPGSFFTRTDPDTNKGFFRVRPGADFQMNTMYRKRDRHSRLGSAVAVLVGKHEKTNDEKTLEVIFDMDAISEQKAKEWWEEHRDRFESPRKSE
jgi:hypothetical protein